MAGFEVRETRVVSEAAFLTLVAQDITTPDGEEIVRYTVRHPGAVAVVAVDDQDRVALVRQYRAPIDRELLELPAGKREEGEPPDTTALRELEEEVGVTARSVELMAAFFNSPGFCDEFTHVYLARGLAPSAAANPAKAEERHMTVVWLPFAEAEARLAAGEIEDAKTLIGLTVAARHRREERA